jgi:phage baseplate assembly protein gpV
MNSDGLLNLIQRVVHQELARQRTSLLGVVTEVFPHEVENDENNYETNVRLKHEDLELRRVPLAVGHIGIAAPPRVGDLVLVQFVNGDLNQPVVTGRFYHADDRPPLHQADDILFEQRVPDGSLNHLRFTPDGAIYLQREVTKPEDNSAATAGLTIDKEGNIEIQTSEKILITLKTDGQIEIKCDTLTLDGKLHVKGDTVVETQIEVGTTTPKTTITPGEITGS